MLDRSGQQITQGRLPALQRLLGQPVHEIATYISEACRPRSFDGQKCLSAAAPPPHGGQLPVVKRLHSDRYTIDADREPGSRIFERDCLGRRLERHLGIDVDAPSLGQAYVEDRQPVRRQITGSAAAVEDRLKRLKSRAPAQALLNLSRDYLAISLHAIVYADGNGKVAEVAVVRAKWDMNVSSLRHWL